MDLNRTTLDFFNQTNSSVELSMEEKLAQKLGPRTHDTLSAAVLLTIYGLIFISGTVGNVCTCIVIVRNSNMQTATNYYLFSLAISDVLILILALPPEAYSIWEAYPWRFGEVFCYIKAVLQELTSNASILTITAFTMERYVAICHPLKAHKFANLSRSIKIIVVIWVLSLTFALPYPLHTGLFYYIDADSNNGTPVVDSLICNIPPQYYPRMTYFFQLSTFLFFVFPMTVIVVIYFLIALALRRAALQRVASQESGSKMGHGAPVTQSGKAVFRMLVAVVVAFFICWSPFHAQRLFTIYNRDWTPVLLQIQSTLFYTSGVLYFVGSTVNPILYNLMSKRYREAFKETIFRCRRKRTAYLCSSGCHQSFYVTRNNTKTTRTALQAQAISLDEQSSKSEDNKQADGCAIADNGDSLRAQLLEEMEHCRQRSYGADGMWSDNRNKTYGCKTCIDDHTGCNTSPYMEELELLNRTHSESAC